MWVWVLLLPTSGARQIGISANMLHVTPIMIRVYGANACIERIVTLAAASHVHVAAWYHSPSCNAARKLASRIQACQGAMFAQD